MLERKIENIFLNNSLKILFWLHPHHTCCSVFAKIINRRQTLPLAGKELDEHAHKSSGPRDCVFIDFPRDFFAILGRGP